jgi:aminopeptidase N
MREATPKAILLKDYTPPDFLVDTVDLYIELEENTTRVTAKLALRRNPASNRTTSALALDGEALSLHSLKIDGHVVAADRYSQTTEMLVINDINDQPFELEVVTHINPAANTALEGLYLSDGLFCTQCEAQGFRKITYFPDRPDIMAIYTTTLVADKTQFPVLLSNGNPMGGGDLLDNRHWVKWVDPYRKPCYLFALVGGQLEWLEDRYTTRSGREITLRIFVETHDLDKCGHAMASLKNAMRWDEEAYGREYDLDLYMIVAVSQFNMGAMENKGLNIFNTKYVLARPDTATDADYEHIEGVIGHEYFHNWTGNRITCRDWFQLSLKEGLTVFRDQEFSADRNSRAVKRIDEVNMLRTRQFAEDAGPLSHPIRPESYIEINNFYTLTIYEKGAEVVRMLHTLLGKAGFRKGTDLYFQRHDEQAVTCEDFIRCMEEANQIDLGQFRLWYSQSGTPELEIASQYDATRARLELRVKQSCPATPDQPTKAPLHIPLALGLLGPDGTELPMQLEGELQPAEGTTRILHIREADQRFTFINLPQAPAISALRGFSAPVKLQQARPDEELAFLFAHDTDAFNRWDAGQQLATRMMLNMAHEISEGKSPGLIPPLLIEAYRHIVRNPGTDLSYCALLLTLPSEDYVSASLEIIDPVAVHAARQHLKQGLATHLEPELTALYQGHHRDDFNQFDAAAIGRRRLKNTCLSYLSERETSATHALAVTQFETSRTMTDRIAALTAITHSQNPQRDTCLAAFYQQWHADPLVVGKWFSLQATNGLPGTLARVEALVNHPAFDLRLPNQVRSLIGAFSQSNPVSFHASDGSGYRFLADHVIALNAINPQIASRMLTALTPWRRYDSDRQTLMREQLQRVAGSDNISRDVYEVASKALA